MIWLIAQTWFWMVVAFGFGVLAAWLIAVIAWPREDELAAALEAEDAPPEVEGELETTAGPAVSADPAQPAPEPAEASAPEVTRPASAASGLDPAFAADEDDTVEMDVTDVAGEEKR